MERGEREEGEEEIRDGNEKGSERERRQGREERREHLLLSSLHDLGLGLRLSLERQHCGGHTRTLGEGEI